VKRRPRRRHMRRTAQTPETENTSIPYLNFYGPMPMTDRWWVAISLVWLSLTLSALLFLAYA
jgi:hypothetical protein